MCFECPGCRTKLKVDYQLALLGILIWAPALALSISRAMDTPIMWFSVLGAAAFSFLVQYWLFSVKLWK